MTNLAGYLQMSVGDSHSAKRRECQVLVLRCLLVRVQRVDLADNTRLINDGCVLRRVYDPVGVQLLEPYVLIT